MYTITEVSRGLAVSTRMLRYYEQQGLIASRRREDYAYRIYDEENVNRLRIILVLRRLRVPLKAIAAILRDRSAQEAVQVLQARVAEVEGEIRSLESIRELLKTFIGRIGAAADAQARLALLGDEGLMAAVQALGLTNDTLKERTLMNEVNQAQQEEWRKLNVRILMLPPMPMAAFRYVGAEPENPAQALLNDFVRREDLYARKPDSRVFGFNHPSPAPGETEYGYEYWVSIPEDMDVPPPGVKKHFPGGLYAAHTMTFPNFHEWQWLVDWVMHHEDYAAAFAPEGDEVMGGCLEEHLNWVYAMANGSMGDGMTRRLDLLLPVRHKGKQSE